MKTRKLVWVAIYICLSMMRCVAQSEQDGSLGKDSMSAGVDISRGLEMRLERWKKNDLLLILICPQVISPDDDPLAHAGQQKKLSVLGFGRLEKKDANSLVSSIDKKSLRVPRLTGGFYVDLYFLYGDSQFSRLDKLMCYVSNGFVDVKIDDDKGRGVWVGLSEKCSKLIESNFAKDSFVEPHSPRNPKDEAAPENGAANRRGHANRD